MRRTSIAAAAALITLLSACSSSSDDDSASTTTTVADEAEAAAGIPPAPDQATTDAYIAALDAINPGIVHRLSDETHNVESAVDRGRNACSTILDDPADRARQIDTTNRRFTAPDAPDGWGPEVAEQILDVVHQHLCPDA